LSARKWNILGVKTGSFPETDTKDRKIVVKDWLRHPGTGLIVRALSTLSKKKLLEYDKAVLAGDFETARNIAALRYILNTVLPNIIECVMNEQDKQKKWKFSNWYRRIMNRRK
jgi:hypothetical protein